MERAQGWRYSLGSDGQSWGFAQGADGLFAVVPGEEEGARRVRLVGCRPQGGLRESAERVGSRRAVAGHADVGLLDAEGAEMGSYFVSGLTVLDVESSGRGAGLVDLTVALWCENALPGSGAVWELVRTGRLNRTGMWHGLTPGDRRAWLSVALWSADYQRRGKPDAEAGGSFTLDGRHIADRDTFYCAIGEAVNGPGGYFGWNLDALVDCLRRGWGATPPFTLHWESSAQAADRDGVPFGLILEILGARGVRVVLH